ncbi:class I SAM-dependent methyltransferase [Methylobacterium sp. A54F]
MTEQEIRAGLAAVKAEHGPWGSANVALPHGLSTLGPGPRGDNHRTLKFLQIVADWLGRPIAGLRVVDLACGEGLYAIEFAQHGAEVLGIEGRRANLAKAEFVKRAWGLDNLRLVEDDVRRFTVSAYGSFDVVLCSGILYHLDAPDVFHFLDNIRGACTGLTIIDSRVSLERSVSADFAARTYWGCAYAEHAEDSAPAERLANLGASLDNPKSFWFTRASLANCLLDLGYTSVMECLGPVPLNTRADRATLVARPGRRVQPYSAIGARLDAHRWPEDGPGAA